MIYFEVRIYIHRRLKPLATLLFESKDSCNKFLITLQEQSAFVKCGDMYVKRSLIKYVRTEEKTIRK